MLLEIPLYAKKNAQIMLDSQNNATLVSRRWRGVGQCNAILFVHARERPLKVNR